jgi:SAM-dependent methyltransferase
VLVPFVLTSVVVVQENIEKFIAELQQSLAGSTFVKLTLANYKGDEPYLQKILCRLIETKKGTRLFVQFRFDQRDVVKNFDFDKGVQVIHHYLLTGFRSGHLFTTERDLQLDTGKKNSRLNAGKATFKEKPSASHDREKKHLIDPSVFYLNALGITTDKAEIRADQRDKWKQINKFVEILDGLYRQSELAKQQSLTIVDMGSGKGYVTFAAYDHFKNSLGIDVHVTGIDTRSDLVELCNQIAAAGSFDGLKFTTGSIDEFSVGDVDILIALHACDTATDDALYKGIAANASIIVAAPCCHREVRRQLKPPAILAPVLRHPVMLERTAETITDGLRSLLLERSGYSTKMFEFVATEHTPKNNMLVAVRKNHDAATTTIDRQIKEIRDTFEIKHQRLADLIGLKE